MVNLKNDNLAKKKKKLLVVKIFQVSLMQIKLFSKLEESNY